MKKRAGVSNSSDFEWTRLVSGLPTKGGVRALFGQDRPDVYGVLSVGGETRQTAVAKNTVQHSYQEDWKEWAVEEVEGHLLELNMYDQDTSSSDEFLGYAAVDLTTQTQVTHQFNNAQARTGGGKSVGFERNVIK